MNNKHTARLLLVVFLLLALAACTTTEDSPPISSDTSEVGAAQLPSDSTTQEPASPTAELAMNRDDVTSAAAEVPSKTPQRPTVTPQPTSTPEPALPSATESSPEPAPEPTTFPLPDGWLGPENFGETVNPLTGVTAEDPSLLDRRPIAIKVSNYPEFVRPQNGLNNADLVFEHYAEGGATRFTAVYYGDDAHTVGSVRSARIIDFEIPVMYDAAFGYSGSAGTNKDRFSGVSWFDRIISPDFGHGGFYRNYPEDEDVDFWHTMFTDTYRLREILQERELDTRPQLNNGMFFSPEPPNTGTPAEQIEIGYRGSYVTWWYDSGVERYYRWNDGERHYDANRGEQINFKNIVVISALHVETDIPETEVGQGAYSIEIQIWGEGPASIFRDGQRFEGRWHRNDPQDMLTFTDLDGNPLPLSPGNTWFHLVPLGFDKLYVTS
jgi:hypothetical protein